jgi:AcrR family transcriptional regulator
MLDSMSSAEVSGSGTRERIVRAALALLEDSGGAPISMADIASRAGVSRQALYLHFADRTALLVEASRAADAANRTPRRQARVDQAPSARDALRETVALQAYLKPRLHAMTVSLDVLRRSDDAAEAAWQERDQARLSRCRQVAQRLDDEGELSAAVSVDEAAALIWVTTSPGVWEDLTVNLRWSTTSYTDRITRFLEAALL